MIRGLQEELEQSSQIITEKIRVGVKVTKVSVSGKELLMQKDCKGNEINYVEVPGLGSCEVIDTSRDGKNYFVRVEADNPPREFITFPRSVPYFILPPDLEGLYGKRCNEIDIMLLSNDRELVCPNSYRKYGAGALSCMGSGTQTNKEDASDKDSEPIRRFNEVTGEWDTLYYSEGESYPFICCPCAYSKYFEDEIIDEITSESLLEEQKRTIKKMQKETKQVLVQGAWRNIASYNKEKDILSLEPIKPSCEIRFQFIFTTPLTKGIHLKAFEGGGKSNLKIILNRLNDLQQATKLSPDPNMQGRLTGIPLKLSTYMRERKIKGKDGTETQKHPAISIDLAVSITELATSGIKSYWDKLTPEAIDKDTGAVLMLEANELEQKN
jgi:urease gamma subunit